VLVPLTIACTVATVGKWGGPVWKAAAKMEKRFNSYKLNKDDIEFTEFLRREKLKTQNAKEKLNHALAIPANDERVVLSVDESDNNIEDLIMDNSEFKDIVDSTQ